MQIVFHLGAHGTDKDRLLRALLKNREAIAKHHTETPAPNRYRGVIGEAMNALNGGAAPAEMQEVLLDSMLDGERTERLVLSHAGFLGMPFRAISAQGIYANASQRIMALSNLFPDSEVEFFLALKHPASLLLSVLQDSGRPYAEVMDGVEPDSLRWAPAIRRMVQAAQGRRIVLWCNEDTPLIWPEVLHRIANIPGSTPLRGNTQVLAELLPPDKLRELQDRIAGSADMSIDDRRTMVEQALAAHAIAEKVEVETDLPGWTQDLIDQMSDDYDRDVAQVAGMPGVEFLAP